MSDAEILDKENTISLINLPSSQDDPSKMANKKI
jgi:hypothetical protein